MLVEAAIADAYGGQFEWGVEPEEIALHNDLTYKMIQPGLIKPGCYTDDGQMSIALAEALVEDDPWTKESIADRFVQCFRRDPRRGYTGPFYEILTNVKTGHELLSKIHGNSEKSGAAMRSAVLGFIPDVEELTEKCITQANITHNTDAGRSSALFVALFAHYFRYVDFNNEDFYKWVPKVVSPEVMKHFLANYQPWPDFQKVSTLGWNCVRAARTAVLANSKMSDILKQSVSYGGDTDTVACIALAIASQFRKNDLPQRLYDKLENDAYGRDYLIELDGKLEKKFPKR